MPSLSEFFSHTRRFFELPHTRSVWNERERLDTLWSVTKDSNPIRRVGTAKEALKAFSDYEKFLHEHHRVHVLFSQKNSAWDPDGLRIFLNDSLMDSDIGDPRTEGFFARNEFHLGYTVERDTICGFQKEVIQSRTQSLTVLRRDSKIIAAYLGPFQTHDMRHRARVR